MEIKKTKSWLNSVSAFANGIGGLLFFGINNDRNLVNIENTQFVCDKISELINSRIDPIPSYIIEPCKEKQNGVEFVYIVLKVKSGPTTPYYYSVDGNREAYVRSGNQSVKAPRYILEELILKGRNKTYDSLITNYLKSDYSFTFFEATFYENTEDYEAALKMYFAALDIIDYVFKEDEYIPQLYKVENGNIYCFIARTYIIMNNIEECLKWLEKMVEVEKETIPKKNKDFIVNNKFLYKANRTNFATIGSINGDNNVVNCLTLDCFKKLEKLDMYQKLLLVAKQIY